MKVTKPRGTTRKLILCDFDGTITQEDVGHNFLNRFTRESWEDIDRDYVQGKIGSREAYSKISRLIVGTKEEMVDFICRESLLDPHFKSFYTFCRENGFDLKIVSDGFGLYIEALLERHGIGGIEYSANRIIPKSGGKIEIDFPFHDPECGNCGNCKRKILRGFRDEYDQIVFVGNGLSDRCIAEDADEVYAKSTLYNYCIEKDISCWHYHDFSDVKKNLSKKIKGIIFDLDGTLLNSIESIHKSFNYALESLGYKQVQLDELRILSQNSIVDTMNQLVGPGEIYRVMRLFKEKYTELVVDAPPLFVGARRVISTLKDCGLLLGIATNMEGEQAKKILRQANIELYFTTIVGADTAKKSKPNPEMIYDVLGGMNLPEEDTVFVGDSVIDVETGKNAEVDVYAVPTGFETKERLSQKRPKRILSCLEDLIEVIGNSTQG